MSKTNWKEIIWGGLIFALLVGLILYGINSRPLLDYYLKCPDKIYVSSNTLSDKISLEFRNRGVTDANILATIESSNASIESTSKSSTVSSVNKSISFHYILQQLDSYTEEQVKVTSIDLNSSSFMVSMNIKKIFDFSISGIFAKVFGETKGYFPIECTYNKTSNYWSGEEYQKIS